MEHSVLNGLPPPLPGVDLDLEKVLGDMPRKRFEFTRKVPPLESLDIAPGITVLDALIRVLHLPSVCSKRFLTTKVDRCVTGLVAQQQTVGPLQLPLADVAVITQTYTGLSGGACAIGEQPIKKQKLPHGVHQDAAVAQIHTFRKLRLYLALQMLQKKQSLPVEVWPMHIDHWKKPPFSNVLAW